MSKPNPSLLPLGRIEPNPDQPRHQFDPAAMEELMASIAQHGLLTPITVRERGGGYYQIIAGERRWRACRALGMTELPALVVQASDGQVMAWALVENLQRQDLNPLEEAQGYAQLLSACHMTQEEVAVSVGKSRSTITNALRLLQLDAPTQALVQARTLSAGHARALLAIHDPAQRAQAVDKVVHMNVRQAEAYAKQCNRAQAQPPAQPFAVDYVALACARLESVLGRRVQHKPNGKAGTLSLAYHDAQDLENLLNALENLHG